MIVMYFRETMLSTPTEDHSFFDIALGRFACPKKMSLTDSYWIVPGTMVF